MATTRAFRSGNSQAVRIPAEIAFEDGQELTVTRNGDVVTICPADKLARMREAIELLRTLPRPDGIEIYEPMQLPDREML